MKKLVTNKTIRKIILNEWLEEFKEYDIDSIRKCANCNRFNTKREYLDVYKSSFSKEINYSIKCTKPSHKCKNGFLSGDEDSDLEIIL